MKNYLCNRNHQENRADKRVQPKKGHIYPVQTAATRNPMFQHQAAHNQQPTNNVNNTESTKQSEREQQSAH
jgi:hypothetical protein